MFGKLEGLRGLSFRFFFVYYKLNLIQGRLIGMNYTIEISEISKFPYFFVVKLVAIKNYGKTNLSRTVNTISVGTKFRKIHHVC